jgi:hypothetical protein
MARRQGNALNLDQNELLNPRLQNLPSAPASPKLGQFYFDTALDRACFKAASQWYDPTQRSTHQGTQAASTIVDLASVVKAYRLDEFSAPTGPVSFGGQRATNGATPTAAGDLATKNYVDNLVQGLDWKASVRVIATSNITLSGLQAIDGVTLLNGDRVLCVAQTNAADNRIWLASNTGWTPAPDSVAGNLTSGASVMITEGSANNKSTQWRLITADPISVGTTNLQWTQIGAVISYTGTGGIVVTGNVISPDTTILVRKAAVTIGDGAALNYACTHSLNTLDVTVCAYQISDGAEIDVDVLHSSVNAVTLIFANAPTSNSIRVVMHG